MELSLGVVVSIACVGFTNLSMKDRGLGALIMSAHSNSCLYLCAHSTSLLRLTSTSCPHNTQHGSVRTSITISTAKRMQWLLEWSDCMRSVCDAPSQNAWSALGRGGIEEQ